MHRNLSHITVAPRPERDLGHIIAAREGTNGPRPRDAAALYLRVMNTNESSATITCPIENVTVDSERCARCYFRGSDHPTCTSSDRISINDWHFLLRAL